MDKGDISQGLRFVPSFDLIQSGSLEGIGDGRESTAFLNRRRCFFLHYRARGCSVGFYSMSAQIRQERNAYYDILETTQKGGLDITPWLEWFLGCLDRAFDGAETILATVLKKARFWEKHAGASLHNRQRTVINKLLDGFEGKLTTSRWATLTKSSQDTALRDIDDLIQRGILTKDAGGGRSTSYSLAEIS